MKKRISRSAKILVFVVGTALICSGFTAAGDSADEVEAVHLMQKRTETMQRAMFGNGRYADIYSGLSQIEVHPLLKEDMESVSEYSDADLDKVVNMKVTDCRMTTKKATIRFYEISVRWYMFGYGGYYTEDVSYSVRTVMHGQKMLLSYIRPIS